MEGGQHTGQRFGYVYVTRLFCLQRARDTNVRNYGRPIYNTGDWGGNRHSKRGRRGETCKIITTTSEDENDEAVLVHMYIFQGGNGAGGREVGT